VKKVLLAAASSLLASFASANPVTIDPDGLAEALEGRLPQPVDDQSQWRWPIKQNT
jgi:hypothetical protein